MPISFQKKIQQLHLLKLAYYEGSTFGKTQPNADEPPYSYTTRPGGGAKGVRVKEIKKTTTPVGSGTRNLPKLLNLPSEDEYQESSKVNSKEKPQHVNRY